mmetsp:Transcript_55671/g.134938  ORF Transcript_55671/g.134938 Transcript_55671/m.134938 type:complete len:632 (+) Transcript_55671:138-2033(+)|eukprot:CAMPEP_0113446650 /NCGR_PEP_ID=MMETSP0014_2-20120614/3822_1 /TAXON_ID=2857 /ORGANISM="Nitzschia sp." /LENGTH=631 /DNA_ID=CAMNT_0000337761 /DNA_START=70 /DNA_END=1965 /DNA_ORIENTATION=+ /assembly_acc=CAM_ASM_000159
MGCKQSRPEVVEQQYNGTDGSKQSSNGNDGIEGEKEKKKSKPNASRSAADAASANADRSEGDLGSDNLGNILSEVFSGDETDAVSRRNLLVEQHNKNRSDKAFAALNGTKNNSPPSMRNVTVQQQEKDSLRRLSDLKMTALPGREVYEDEDGIDMFFDTAQTFSEILEMMAYPPTSTMRSHSATVDEPQSLLSQRNLTGITEGEEEDEEEEMMAAVGNVRASVVAVRKELTKDSTHKLGSGYPGDLTESELDACLKFREELKIRDPAYRQMVLAYSPQEDEAFALCRFLRARQFNYEEVFEMLEGNNVVEIWNIARNNDFWKDVDEHFGCPITVIQSLFPALISGLGKNGACVLYFKAGDINVDGLECITDLPDLVPFVWHIMHFKGSGAMQREIERHDPKSTTVLAEKIVVVDLKGLPSALFGSDGIQFLKSAANHLVCFPEILNRMYMLNVPTTFSIIWAVLKAFMEPRTIRKVGFFSRLTKAKEDMVQFIDSDEIIADYGGGGETFQDLLTQRQKEYSGFRHLVSKHICVNKTEVKFDFLLTKTQTIHSIVVYTKSDNCSAFTVKQGTKIVVGPTAVRRSEDSKKRHYNVDLPVSNNCVGTSGTFTVSAKSEHKTKDHYLVVVNVTEK